MRGWLDGESRSSRTWCVAPPRALQSWSSPMDRARRPKPSSRSWNGTTAVGRRWRGTETDARAWPGVSARAAAVATITSATAPASSPVAVSSSLRPTASRDCMGDTAAAQRSAVLVPDPDWPTCSPSRPRSDRRRQDRLGPRLGRARTTTTRSTSPPSSSTTVGWLRSVRASGPARRGRTSCSSSAIRGSTAASRRRCVPIRLCTAIRGTPSASFGRLADRNRDDLPLCNLDGNQEHWALASECPAGPVGGDVPRRDPALPLPHHLRLGQRVLGRPRIRRAGPLGRRERDAHREDQPAGAATIPRPAWLPPRSQRSLARLDCRTRPTSTVHASGSDRQTAGRGLRLPVAARWSRCRSFARHGYDIALPDDATIRAIARGAADLESTDRDELRRAFRRSRLRPGTAFDCRACRPPPDAAGRGRGLCRTSSAGRRGGASSSATTTRWC